MKYEHVSLLHSRSKNPLKVNINNANFLHLFPDLQNFKFPIQFLKKLGFPHAQISVQTNFIYFFFSIFKCGYRISLIWTCQGPCLFKTWIRNLKFCRSGNRKAKWKGGRILCNGFILPLSMSRGNRERPINCFHKALGSTREFQPPGE